MLDKEKIKSGITGSFGKNIIVKEETDSTNSEAKRNCSMEEGTVFLAECQTAGRGRTGRRWESETGVGIWMSVLLKPLLSPEKIPLITLVTGLSICTTLRKRGLDAYIKWPNDIVAGGKKICGILVETLIDKTGISAAAGVGINANHKSFKGELSDKATSYLIETGKSCERELLIADILSCLEKYYRELAENGFCSVSEEYRRLCISIGRQVRVINPDGEYEAEAVDITDSGELVVETDAGKKILNSGEVSVRGIYGYV